MPGKAETIVLTSIMLFAPRFSSPCDMVVLCCDTAMVALGYLPMEFAEQIESAYEHLYDLVYLRTHPLMELLAPDTSLSRKDRAWRLHQILLEAIEELNPGSKAPTFSREWRRHRLMVLRYVDGLDPQSIADQIAVGRRHYYREQKAAIEAIAHILRDRYLESYAQATGPATQKQAGPGLTRLEMLRLEAARAAQANRYPDAGDIIRGALDLLQDRLVQRRLVPHLELPDGLPRLSIERNLLRQMLLGMLAYLAERAEGAEVRLAAKVGLDTVRISARVEPPEAVRATPAAEVHERLSAFEELAALGGACLRPLQNAESVTGFEVCLPSSIERTILVVDDNSDTLDLFQRYLRVHHYQAALACSARDALELAHRLQPQAIILDLMLPDRDGWELLQLLLGQPDTCNIPVIICTVLRQKELALSLGAAAFLEKPVSEEALMAALAAIEREK